MAAGGRGVLLALAFYVFMYGQWCFLNDLAFQKFYLMNNATFVDITNCSFNNLDGFSHTEVATFIGRKSEVEWTPKNVNKRNDNTKIKPTVKLVILLFLMRSGDVHPQPGPMHIKSKSRQPKHPCTVCERGVISTSKAVSCDDCQRWVHVNCTKTITIEQYNQLVQDNTDFSYMCDNCLIKNLPFNREDFSDDSQNIKLDNPPSTYTDYFTKFKKKGLHFIHCNARSLLPKLSEVKIVAMKTEAAVISITESWLDESITNAEIHIDNYNIVRSDRSRNGGGVCMYIRKDLAFSPRTDLQSDNTETIWIDILLPKTKPILIGTVYRPPKDNDFFEYFEEQLNKIIPGCEIYILGDFNICFMHKLSVLYKKYQNCLNMFNLKQIIDEPTRVTCSSKTLIDHIVVNSEEKISQSGVLPIGLSDHFLIYCTRNSGSNKNCGRKQNDIKIRSTKNYDKDVFIDKLNKADWSKLYLSRNINSAWSIFRDIFLSVLDEVAPFKEIKVKKHTEPWITSDILEQIHHRDYLLHMYKKTGSKFYYTNYCKVRNKVQRDVKTAKSLFFEEKIEENKNSPKKLWQQFKNLGYSTKQKETSNIVLNVDNINCHDSSIVANHFNTFFTNVAASLVAKLPAAPRIYYISSNIFRNFYRRVLSNNICFELKIVEENFILKELEQLNPSKSTGLDGISPRFLRDGACSLKKPITYLVNLSITSGIVPDDMKIARVCPIFKKNSRLEVGNYRPVSILVVISKILEKSVYIQLEKYLVDNKLLYNFQSGFRTAHSTDTCLIHLLDHIKTQSSKGLYTGMIMLDLQKAFDTVDHFILCSKLQTMGVISIKWFESYLTERKQKISVNGTESNFLTVTCGVPQGSILGPLLFLCYVNDMSISISSECKLLLYADDSTILFSHGNPGVISEKLGKELQSCSQWLIDNKLSLHLGKTECILFGSKRKLRKINEFQITCNGHTIRAQNSVKYLGLHIDRFLSGEIIIDNIVKKVNSRLKFLYRQGKILSENSRKTLSTALIQCHFDYACSSWYAGLCKQYKNKLQVLQNKTIRYIKNMGNRTTVNNKILCETGFLNIDSRVSQLRLNHVHKIFYHKKSPHYMKENFTKVRDCHHYFTRSSEYNFFVPPVKGQQLHTFYYNGIKDWNSLPVSLKSIKNTEAFKSGVKTFLSERNIVESRNCFTY